MAILLWFLQLCLVTALLAFLGYKFGSRILAFAAPKLANAFGAQLRSTKLSFQHITGLDLQFHKGPVRHVAVDEILIHLKHGLLGSVSALLQGKCVVEITVSGIRVIANATKGASKSSNHDDKHSKSKPGADTASASDIASKASKVARKLSKALNLAGCVAVQLSNIQVVIQDHDVSLKLARLSWGKEEGDADQKSTTHRLAITQPSVALMVKDENGVAGAQPKEVLGTTGLLLQLTAAKARQSGRPVLDAVSLTLGRVTVQASNLLIAAVMQATNRKQPVATSNAVVADFAAMLPTQASMATAPRKKKPKKPPGSNTSKAWAVMDFLGRLTTDASVSFEGIQANACIPAMHVETVASDNSNRQQTSETAAEPSSMLVALGMDSFKLHLLQCRAEDVAIDNKQQQGLRTVPSVKARESKHTPDSEQQAKSNVLKPPGTAWNARTAYQVSSQLNGLSAVVDLIQQATSPAARLLDMQMPAFAVIGGVAACHLRKTGWSGHNDLVAAHVAAHTALQLESLSVKIQQEKLAQASAAFLSHVFPTPKHPTSANQDDNHVCPAGLRPTMPQADRLHDVPAGNNVISIALPTSFICRTDCEIKQAISLELLSTEHSLGHSFTLASSSVTFNASQALKGLPKLKIAQENEGKTTNEAQQAQHGGPLQCQQHQHQQQTQLPKIQEAVTATDMALPRLTSLVTAASMPIADADVLTAQPLASAMPRASSLADPTLPLPNLTPAQSAPLLPYMLLQTQSSEVPTGGASAPLPEINTMARSDQLPRETLQAVLQPVADMLALNAQQAGEQETPLVVTQDVEEQQSLQASQGHTSDVTQAVATPIQDANVGEVGNRIQLTSSPAKVPTLLPPRQRIHVQLGSISWNTSRPSPISKDSTLSFQQNATGQTLGAQQPWFCVRSIEVHFGTTRHKLIDVADDRRGSVAGEALDVSPTQPGQTKERQPANTGHSSVPQPYHAALVIQSPQVAIGDHCFRCVQHTVGILGPMIKTVKQAKTKQKQEKHAQSREQPEESLDCLHDVEKRQPRMQVQQADVQLHDLRIQLQHGIPVVEKHAVSGATPTGTNGQTQHSQDTGSGQYIASLQAATLQADPSKVRTLPAMHVVVLDSLRLSTCPVDRRVVTKLRGFQIQQHIPKTQALTDQTTDLSAQPAIDSSHPLIPLRIETVEVKALAKSDSHFVRSSIDGLHVHAEFDSVLAGLGLTGTLLSHVSSIKKAIGIEKSTDGVAVQQQSAGPLKPKKAKPNLVIELRIAEFEARANVGEQDVIQVSLDLLRGSSMLGELVLDELQLCINNREIVAAQYASLKLPEAMPGDPPAATTPPRSTPMSPLRQGGHTPTRHTAPNSGITSPIGSVFNGGLTARATQGSHTGEHSVSPPQKSRQCEDDEEDDHSSVEGGVVSRQGGSENGAPRSPSQMKDWQRIQHEGATMLGLIWHYEPQTTLGNRRMQIMSGVGATTQKTVKQWRASARERLGLTPQDADSHSNTSTTTGQASVNRKLLGFDIALENATLTFPYDEAPMRVYLLCEIWAKAIKQVMKPCLMLLKSQLAQLKPPKPAKESDKPKSAGPWPLFDKYTEIILETRKVSLVLAQHPLESWMSLHMSALQRTAAERRLWERLLTSLPTPRVTAHDTPTAVPTTPLGVKGLTVGPEGKLVGPLQKALSKSQRPLEEQTSIVSDATVGDGVDSDVTASIMEDSMSSDENGPTDMEGLSPRTPNKSSTGAGHDLQSAIPHTGSAFQDNTAHSYWESVMRKVASVYQDACKDLRLQARSPGAGGLIHVYGSRAGAVIMLCKPGVNGRVHAAHNIARLDAASQGLLFERMVLLSLDASLTDVSIKCAVSKSPLLTAGSLSASGLLIRARQMTAAPKTREVVFKVGRFHEAPVPMVIKGARAPMKAYTDMRVEADELEAGGGLALEPLFAQLTKAVKRIIPPDALNPDGTAVPLLVPGQQPLPPWDKMRYMWRGTARLTIRQLKAGMNVGLSPGPPGPQDPCIQLTAATLGVYINTGRLDVTSTALSIVALSPAPDTAPGDPLVLLPMAHLPLINLSANGSWTLASGADALQHHIFPLRYDMPDPSEIQEPLDITSLVRSTGVVMGLDFNLAADYTQVGQRQAAGNSWSSSNIPTTTSARASKAASTDSMSLLHRHFSRTGPGLASSPVPRAYIGELQVSFIKDLIQLFANAPVFFRNSAKKRCFYEPQRAPTTPEQTTMTHPASPNQAHATVSGIGPALSTVSSVPLTASGHNASVVSGCSGQSRSVFSDSSAPPLTPAALITRLDINAVVDVLEVHHDAQDVTDVSDFVFLRAHNLRLGVNLMYSRHVGSIQRGGRRIPRWMRATASTSVQLEAQQLSLVHPAHSHETHTATSPAPHRRAASNATGDPQSSTAMRVPGFGEGLICSASRLQLKLAPAARGPAPVLRLDNLEGGLPGMGQPAQPQKRPLRMVVQDVQLYASAVLRDAVMGTVMHMIAAFTRRSRPAQPQLPSLSHRAASGPGDKANNSGAGIPVEDDTSAGQAAREGSLPSGDVGNRQAAVPAVSQEWIERNEAALLTALQAARTKRVQGEQQQDTSSKPTTPRSLYGDQEGSVHSEGVSSQVSTPRPITDAVASTAAYQDVSSRPAASQQGMGTHPDAERNSGDSTASGQQGGNQLQLVFEMEFVRVQVAILPVSCPGAFLFATNSARLASMRHATTGRKELTTTMNQLQAYAIRQLVDGQPSSRAAAAAIPWLSSQDGKLAAPLPGSAVTTVMTPFSVQITHTKQPPEIDTGSGDSLVVQVPSIDGVLESWQFECLLDVVRNVLLCPLPQVPMILPHNNPAGPQQPSSSSHDAASSVVAAREVLHALTRSLACMHQEIQGVAPGAIQAAWLQGSIGSAVDGGVSAAGFAPQPGQLLTALLAPGTSTGQGGARARAQSKEVLLAWCLDQVSGAAESVEAAKSVLAREEAAAELLARSTGSALQGAKRGGPLSATVIVGQFSWALSKSGSVFLCADLHGLEYTSALDRNYTGTTRLALRGISLREVPGTGSGVSTPSNSQASLAAVAATASAKAVRHVLRLWSPGSDSTASNIVANQPPSSSSVHDVIVSKGQQDSPVWEYDFAFSMAAVHGGLQAPNFVVYDHLEVMLHPLEVHLTFALAQQLQDYFALEESSTATAANPSTTAASQQAAAVAAGTSTAGLPSQPSAGLPSALARIEDEDTPVPGSSPNRVAGWFHKRSATAGMPAAGETLGPLAAGARAGGAMSKQSGPLPGSVSQDHAGQAPYSRSRAMTADNIHPPPGSTLMSAENARYGALYRQQRGRQLSALPAAGISNSTVPGSPVLDAYGRPVAGARGRFKRKLTSQESQKPGSRSGRMRGSSGNVSIGNVPTTSQGSQGRAGAVADPRAHHLYIFKHVRFNRMHVRLTYDGPPISLNEFKAVLDSRVYVNVEGEWKTLLNKYKWDVIRSILKSMAGLQRGKVQELERGKGPLARIGAAAAAAAAAYGPESLAKGGALRHNFKSFLGIGKGKNKGSGAGGSIAASVDDAGLAELLAAAEQLRARQARLSLLLGSVPAPPVRKVLLEQEAGLSA